MRARHIIVIVALFCVTSISWAQQRKSPRRYAPIPFEGDLETMLRDRLARSSDWEELLKRMPPGLKKLPQLDKLKNDERFRELLRMLKDQKLDNIKWDNLKDLEKVIKKRIDKQTLPPVIDNPKPDVPINKGVNPPKPPPFAKPNPKPPRKDDLETRFDRWVKDRIKDMDGSNIGDILRDSPAWQKTIEDLGRSLGNIRPNGDGWDLRGVLDKWPLADNLKLPDIEKWLKPPDMQLPELPRFQIALPGMQIDNPLGGVRLPALPGGSSLGGGWQIALWLLAAAGGGFILWQLWKSLERRGERIAGVGWSPGPWPILPGSVTTRADLVACFDHLSLLLLGKPAETWNHRAVAERLGGAETSRRQIALDLATLYEWARYSPGEDPLPAASLSEARNALEYFARMNPLPAPAGK